MQRFSWQLARQQIAVLLLITTVAYFGSGFACGGPKTISVAAEAAKDIGGGVRDTIKAVGDAYDKKLITLEQKDRMADLLGAIAKGGLNGVGAIETLQKSGVTTLTGTNAQVLNTIFSDEVIAPFLQLLTELGKLSASSSAAICAALISVRTAIVLLSSKIGRVDVIQQINRLESLNA